MLTAGADYAMTTRINFMSLLSVPKDEEINIVLVRRLILKLNNILIFLALADALCAMMH